MNIHCLLQFTGDTLDPDRVTAALGLIPSSAWRRGELIPGTRAVRNTNGWVLEGPAATTFDLNAYVLELLAVMEPHGAALRGLCRQFSVEPLVRCVAYVEEQAPSALFESKVLQRLAKLGVALDVDLITVGKQTG